MIDEKHELMFGWYLVVFLDVLGQRETLRQVRWPRSEEERSETFSLLKQTAGYVLHFRRFFQNYFENFAQPSGLLDSLSAEHREKIERIKSTSAEYRGFSDSFVASVALRNTDEHLTPATGLYSSLVAACAGMNVSLASKRPLRGGVDVGLGVNITPGEVYGPALERAYILESSVAKYPRIVIGNELWHYISVVEAESAVGAYGQIARQLIQKVKELIVIDEDGLTILDYLGPGILALATPGFANDVVKPAYDFVVQQHQGWESNAKLGERYGRVRRYFEKRLSLWGLGII